MKQLNTDVVRWENLLPKEFVARQSKMPVVYLPMGICEPHGHVAPLGLDTIKAVAICERAALEYGGIVAPTLGYQIHEAGYHARWLQDEVGEKCGFMTGMPPDVMMRFFLFQLRAFANAGFQAIVAVSGHAGGNQEDFRLVGELFEKQTGIRVIVKTDPELTNGKYTGDHAGKYEISQLLHLRPDLMKMERIENANTSELGKLAQGKDAHEATAEFGKEIMDIAHRHLGEIISQLTLDQNAKNPMINYHTVEKIWSDVVEKKDQWLTVKPYADQLPVGADSQWKPYENV